MITLDRFDGLITNNSDGLKRDPSDIICVRCGNNKVKTVLDVSIYNAEFQADVYFCKGFLAGGCQHSFTTLVRFTPQR